MQILITAGPTREYIDDVRYLSNASSGKMGYALADAACAAGCEVILISGPVHLPVPKCVEYVAVETTVEMRDACLKHFPHCDGVIAAAAVSDYKPAQRVTGKMSKTGGPITINMIETDDVLAELGCRKSDQWIIGFALEAENARENALQKLRAKNCDFIVLNAPSAIGADDNNVELLGPDGAMQGSWQGPKREVAEQLIDWLKQTFAS